MLEFMSMKTLILPTNTIKEAGKISSQLGIPREDVIANALSYYSRDIEAQAHLERELSAWDLASDRDFHSFENSISKNR